MDCRKELWLYVFNFGVQKRNINMSLYNYSYKHNDVFYTDINKLCLIKTKTK